MQFNFGGNANQCCNKVVPAAPIRKGETLLVDGANVMQAANCGVRLELLLVLLMQLAKVGGAFCCIFDANTRFRLHKFSGVKVRDAFLELLRSYPRHFAESTGGLPADELLLQRADSMKQRIITNDRFTDFRERYPWLNEEDKHLVKLVVVGDELQVPTLRILAKWDRPFGPIAKELISVLGKP